MRQCFEGVESVVICGVEDVPVEKRICAQCTASSQERNLRETRKLVRSAHKMDQT